jgi:plasmid stability protein
MPNITLSVPAEVLQRARVRAAQQGTSVSAMVRSFLMSVGESDEEFRRLERQQREVLAELGRFAAGGGLRREQLHDRALR